ncbi:MAG: hypothetical protein AAFQ65_07670 [Myxococcota bacterium]
MARFRAAFEHDVTQVREKLGLTIRGPDSNFTRSVDADGYGVHAGDVQKARGVAVDGSLERIFFWRCRLRMIDRRR